MNFHHTIDLSIDKKVKARLEVSFTEKSSEPDEFRVAVKRSSGGVVEAEAVWHVEERDGQFVLQITLKNVAAGVCLAGCLAGIVTSAGPLIDCLKKAKSREEARICITEHGLWQAVGSLSCIYGCLQVL